MPFDLRYHPDVKKIDIPLLNNIRKRIKHAIETRLTIAPHKYGEPLRGTLKGYWKLRVGDLRVVFKVVDDEVWILGIIHREGVYRMMERGL